MVACETESASENNVRITPDRARLSSGQAQVFTASGGYEYRWSLEGGGTADEWGRLSASTGPTTVYTSLKDAPTSGVTRVVRVKSTIPGSGSSTTAGSTNLPTTTTSYSMTAEAYVEHAVAYGPLNATPAVISGLKYAQSQAFTASGGNGTYTWQLSNNALGRLSNANGASTTYTSMARVGNESTINNLVLQSGDGQAVTAIIFHANEGTTTQATTLALSPASTSVALNGSITFTASGGNGAYTWSLSTRQYGMLTASSPNTTTYTCTNSFTNTVIARLTVTSNGESRQAVILHAAVGETLTIDPQQAAILVNESQLFTANGGIPPYTWNLSSTAYGLLAPSGNEALYECTKTNVVAVTVTVRSSDGQTATAILDCN